MLSAAEVKKLETHILGLFQSVIVPEINPQGYILAAGANGETYPDPVTTHHLVELCLEISPILTKEVVDRACNWFINEAQNLQNPFFITTLAAAHKITDDDKSVVIEKAIIPNQKPSGFIDLYAGFLDGGSAFSTLWAIRILSLLQDGTSEVAEKALGAIENHWEDLHRLSFVGFYYEMAKLNDRDFAIINSALEQIINGQSEAGTWDNSLLYTAYVTGNLLAGTGEIDENSILAASKALRAIFELENEATKLPDTFVKARKTMADSAFLQFTLRSLISSIRFLRKIHEKDMMEELSASLFGLIPQVYHSARVLHAELKKMNDQYGGIKRNFDHLEQLVTDSILAENPYNRNVFIMMPFRHENDERYESVVTAIKDTLSAHGFKGWLASDKTLSNQLWDNVACFMLACKYGISVFTRVERETEIRVKEFNPNVSLELGFFLSRGKRVLIMKDAILPSLHTDLVGHLYEQFDLNNSKAQVPPIINKWANELLEDEQTSQPTKTPDV